MLIAIKKNQTLLDFITQHAGAVEELFSVAIANKIGITDNVAAGTNLQVLPTQLRVTRYYTASSELDITTVPQSGIQEGIGFMQIGTNFIVK